MFQFLKTFIDDIQQKVLEKQGKLNDYINSIDDEIVKKASFIPLKRGGTNIKSHNLIIDNFGNYIFKVKGFFPILFLAMFSIPLIATIIEIFIDLFIKYQDINSDLIGTYIGEIIFSLFFLTPALILFYFLYRSYIFDFQNGYFYDTRYNKKLFELLNNEKYKTKIISLKDIHALQIISEIVHGKNTSYTSYELNMILEDSSRVNVIDHGNLEEIRKNASELATKLGVKVYDLTEIYTEIF